MKTSIQLLPNETCGRVHRWRSASCSKFCRQDSDRYVEVRWREVERQEGERLAMATETSDE